jgi:hypothetical protein
MRKSTSVKGFVLALAAAISALASPAHAATIRWELNNFTFADGGTATGFFDWDTIALASTNYEISTSGGDVGTFPPVTYDDETTNFAQAVNTLFFFDSANPLRVFRIGLSSIATLNTPLAALIPVGNILAGPTGFVECFNCGPQRLGDAGAGAYLSAVPEPATVTLIVLGGALSAAVRRRSRQWRKPLGAYPPASDAQ